MQFLVDTGAEVSVIPPTAELRRHPNPKVFLYAANKTTIKIYGDRIMYLNLGLRRKFQWKFIVADVSQPIVGADFLAHFQLLVDLHQRKLVDSSTNVSQSGSVKTIDAYTGGLSFIDSDMPFQDLLREFKDLALTNVTPKNITLDVTHHIITKGPPIFSKPRRLAPDKLKAAKAEIQTLLDA
ncbi:uncharacterized protein LOC118732742, partial [Rhagoletis pomonella]|uniref:uncharacterized protein LOC118732742 n=1 Tax=Rhagoletis pomonella TaxID=28610 RepID=UPI00177D6EFF